MQKTVWRKWLNFLNGTEYIKSIRIKRLRYSVAMSRFLPYGHLSILQGHHGEDVLLLVGVNIAARGMLINNDQEIKIRAIQDLLQKSRS